MPLTTANVYGLLSLVFWALVVIVTLKYVDADHARGQPRRRRHPCADRAGRAGPRSPEPPALVARRLRHLRRGDVLRRRDDHARDLGARRRRGAGGDRAGHERVHRAGRRRDHDRAVRDPEARHGVGREAVRADHAAVVRRARSPRDRCRSLRTRRCCARSRRFMRSASSSIIRWRRSWRSAPSCSPSPAPRRCTRTWATSAGRRSGARGCSSCSRRSRSTISARARLLLAQPAAIKNPFYLMAPSWALVPLLVLATAAAIIASQAVISGAFSLARQAVQMGYVPRLEIQHTSEREIGQIYIPFINWTLLIAVLLLVVGFQSSSALAGAYGIAVTLAMLIDSVLIFFVMRRIWRWSLPLRACDRVAARADRLRVPELQHAQDPGRRLVSAGDRRDRVHADDDLEARPDHPDGAAVRRIDAARRLRAQHRVVAADARAGHGGIPDRDARPRAACAAAQPEAQQGAARARRVPHRRHARLSVRAGRGRALRDRAARRRVLPDLRLLRVQGGSGRAGAARVVEQPTASCST